MPETRINYRAWFWRVITWDGVVPLILFAIPHLILWAFPKFDLENDMALVVISPVAAFFARLVVGLYYINSNHCSNRWRSRQQLSLIAGLFLMTYSDTCMANSVLEPDGGARDIPWLALSLIFFGISLPCMIAAMYPGQEPLATERIGNWEVKLR